MPWRNLNEWDWWAIVIAALLGGIGRLMALSQSNPRPPLGWHLLWEVPLAVGLGWTGLGIADYFKLEGFAVQACSIAVSYLGPRIFTAAADKWLGRS